MQVLSRSRYAAVSLPISFFVIILFSACSDRLENQPALLYTLNKGIENSNSTISRSTDGLLISLEDMLADPARSYRAKIWQPRAILIQQLSMEIYKYIEGLKVDFKNQAGVIVKNGKDVFNNKKADNHLSFSKTKAEELQHKLEKYTEDLFSIDAHIDSVFISNISLPSWPFDSVSAIRPDIYEVYFKNISPLAAVSLLSKFQNDVKHAENKLIQFCYYKCGVIIDDFVSYSAIVGQSSTIVAAGSTIEIFAGMGEFTKSAMPKIQISGKEIPLGEDGVTHYKFKTSSKPGKYAVPVLISYNDQDGKVQVIEKSVEYTVVTEIDQKN